MALMAVTPLEVDIVSAYGYCLGPGGLGPSNRGTPKESNPFHHKGIRSESKPPGPKPTNVAQKKQAPVER